MKKAADEKSPGTSMRAASSRAGGCSVALPPRATTSTPKLCSIRSVWSRVTAGSTTVVAPSAYRPASSSADFTWALATGIA